MRDEKFQENHQKFKVSQEILEISFKLDTSKIWKVSENHVFSKTVQGRNRKI